MSPEVFHQVGKLFAEAAMLLAEDGTVLACNGRVAGLKLTIDRMIEKRLHEFVSAPQSLDDLLRMCSRVQEPISGRLKLRNDRGDEVDCRCQALIVHRDPSGRPIRLIITFAPREVSSTHFGLLNKKIAELTEEVHRRKLLQAELSRQREALHVTLSSIADGVIVTDKSGLITFVNAVAEKLTGWDAVEAHGKPLHSIFRIVNEQTREEVENPVDRVLQTGQVAGLANHTLLIAKGGNEIPIDDSAAPILDADGGLLGTVLIFRDIGERRQAELALKDSETRYRLVCEATHDAIWECDLATGRLTWSESFPERFGYSVDEPGNDTSWFLERVHPDDRGYVMQRAGRAVDSDQTSWEDKFRFQRGNGTYAMVWDRGYIVRDDAGHPLRMIGAIHDLSEQHKAEELQAERLRLSAMRAEISVRLASQESLSAVLQGCCEVLVNRLQMAFARVWTLNPSEQVLELQASAGIYTHLEGPHSRIRVGDYKIGRIAMNRRPHLTNSVATDINISDPQWAQREGMVAFAGYPLTVGERLLGVLGMFARHPLSDAVLDDLAPLADGIGQYIERKWAEEKLRQQERQYRSIFESTTDAMLIYDDEGRVVEANPAACRMHGLSYDELIGLSASEFVLPNDRQSYSRMKKQVNAGQPFYGEGTHLRSDGSSFFVETYGSRIDYQGSPHLLAVGRDISDRKKSQRAMRKRTAQLRRLANIAVRISIAQDVPSLIQMVTQEARELIDAHQSVTSLTIDQKWSQPLTAFVLSDKYSQWQDRDRPPFEPRLYAMVCEEARSVRLTQADLESHPAWEEFCQAAGGSPPLRGWLAAPLVGRDGRNLGFIQLSDRFEGDFTEDDEYILM